jgi:hypothetical protein
MTTDFELACGTQVPLPFGTLRRAPGGRVELEHDVVRAVIVDDLADSDPLIGIAWADWMCAVGSASSAVLRGTSMPFALGIEGRLARLDLDGYDPGGLYRVQLFAISDESCLVDTEMGLCTVRRGGGVGWTAIHDDLTARVVEVGQSEVVISSESSSSRLSLADGRLLGTEPHEPPNPL